MFNIKKYNRTYASGIYAPKEPDYAKHIHSFDILTFFPV